MLRWYCVRISLCMGLLSSAAHAAPTLSYGVSKGCPSQEWFERELNQQELPSDVRGRLNVVVAPLPFRVETSPEPPSRVSAIQTSPVEASPEQPGQLRAQLEYFAPSHRKVREAPGIEVADASAAATPEWQRELSGPSCEELLSVLAVSFAVYLDSREQPEPTHLLHDEPLPPLVEPNWFDPPKLDYVASATWRLGLIAGLGVRTGLAPSATGNWSVGIHLRGVREGWGAGPFQLGFGSAIGPSRNELAGTTVDSTWKQEYWTVHVLACPWMASPSAGMRFGPALGFHGGRYRATLPRVQIPNDDDEVWFAFYELSMLGELQRGPLLARLQLGLQLPLSPYRVLFEQRELFRQQAGLIMGLALGWAGVLL